MTLRIEECLRRLHESIRVVVDVETSGLSWQHNHIVGHVLTFGPREEDSYYLPVRHAGGGNIPGCDVPSVSTGWKGDVHPLEQEIVKALDQPDKHLTFHNGAFDLKFLYRIGVTGFNAKMEDTMLNAVLLNEWQPSVSLDACCKVYGVAQKKSDIYDHIMSKFPEARGKPREAMGHYWRLAGDDPVAVSYAEQDGGSTWQLREAQIPQLELQGLSLVHSIECRCIPVLARMMVRGVKIDQDRLNKVKEIIEERRVNARKALPVGFNSRAPSQVRALMEQGGFTDWPMTAPTKLHPEGQPSFAESWLAKNPTGANIVALRKLDNLENSFINPMIDTHMWNGRVYPEYHQLRGDEYGTVTGRLSSSTPNLQQINKRNRELGELHRSIFIPDEGMLWGSADYSQMEPRLLAYYSRCNVLLEGYSADPPIDAHMSVAKAAGIDRETGKRVNQTLITGGGKGVLTSKYGIAVSEVDGIWDKYFEAMPEIKVVQRQATRKMGQRGYVISLLGRRCRLNNPRKDYVGLNRLLQTGNADCLKVKMVEVDDYLRSEGDDKVNLLSNCHDAFEFQFKPEFRAVYDEALRIMTSFGSSDVIQLDVPIVVDHKEGANWSEATWG